MYRRRGAMAKVVPEYVEIALTRLREAWEAWEGRLRVRPMERPVYDPQGTVPYILPKVVNLREVWEEQKD
jgi:adenine-specific DNA-methyltransferase